MFWTRYLINFPKDFVLLPRTCLFPANGRTPDTYDRITQDGPLPELKVTRSGNHERSYKNTVYRIDILESDAECRGKCELVTISGKENDEEEGNKVAKFLSDT